MTGNFMAIFGASNFDIKFIAFFAVSSLLIVIFGGTVAGIDFSLIVFRALIAVIIFSLLAYAIIFVLRNFLPEVYSLLNKTTLNNGNNETVEISEQDEEESESEEISNEPIYEASGDVNKSEGVSKDKLPCHCHSYCCFPV